MRKSVVFILGCLLIIPALANAWTLVVSNTNANANNYVSVTWPSREAAELAPVKVAVNGSKNVMVTGGEKALVTTTSTAATTSFNVDGVAAVSGVEIDPPTLTTYRSVATVFSATATTPYALNATQVANGFLVLKVGNSTSPMGYSQVIPGTAYSVIATPDAGYKVATITVNGVAQTLDPVTPIAGKPVSTPSLTMGALITTVSATYTSEATLNVALSLPVAGLTGNPFTAAVMASTTPVSSLTYTWHVMAPSGVNTTDAPGTSKIKTIASAVQGKYSVAVTVISASGNATVTKVGYITITDGAAVANNLCLGCHSNSTPALIAAYNSQNHPTTWKPIDSRFVCSSCHTAVPHSPGAKCIGCHSIGQNKNTYANSYVNDNNGVRAITGEFEKWSHHVTGVTLNDAHCAACHREGMVNTATGQIDVDQQYHMADALVHLRNADTDANIDWNPEIPNFTNMDNFCMSCHDADGATSAMSEKIQAFINSNNLNAPGKTASATNPFGDTISNQYDKMERSAVVDASGQFATGNNSHHAVKGKKYTARTRALSASTATFAANSSAALPSGGATVGRKTIFEAGRFESTYVTLKNAAGETDVASTLNGRNGGTVLGDDSTLHCGDCHTVGQFAAKGSAAFSQLSSSYTLAAGAGKSITKFYKTAIGAHGSNNEYLLRNSIGTDARHIGTQFDSAGATINTGVQPYLVCFNCHKFATYGSTAGHAGEKAGNNEDCNGAYNTRAEPNGALRKATGVFNGPAETTYSGVGEDRLMSVITQANKADGTAAASGGLYGAQTTGHFGFLGNIFAIQCANCHNSGPANGYGGIHGSKVQTYVDGMGNTTKAFRFLPGLGNVMYVPGTKKGVIGGTTATYKNYSAYAFAKYSATSSTNRTVKGYLPASYAVAAVNNKNFPAVGQQNVTSSFTYTTGGVTDDANWEQLKPFSEYEVSGQASAMGCYTLGAEGATPVNKLAANGYPADDVRGAKADGMTGVDGKHLLDNWGGCEDHGDAQGGGSHRQTRGVIRPVSY